MARRWQTRAWVVLAVWTAAGGAAWAQFEGVGDFGKLPGGGEPTVQAVPSHTHVAAGQEFMVAAVVDVPPGSKYYAPYPGTDTVNGGEVLARWGDRAIPSDRVRWPKPEPYNDVGGIVTNVYAGKVVVYVPVVVPDDAEPGPVSLRLALDGQTCTEKECHRLPDPAGPKAVAAEVQLQVADQARANPAWAEGNLAAGLAAAKTPAQWKAELEPAKPVTNAGDQAGRQAKTKAPAEFSNLSVWQWLGIALLAGLTLNIMPCVLPVIPIRIVSIVNMAKENKRRIVTLGLAFALGVLLFFVAFAAVSAVLKVSLGRVIDIGEYFGEPVFHIAMGAVMVALAANLFGAFEIVVPSKVAGLEGSTKREGHLASIGMGVMLAVLATPCSFAYLAAALTWAQTQPVWLGSLAIVLIGVGMAAPHALLVAWPDLLKKIPKPGRWMELFKKSMGFVLVLVAIWLFGSLAKDTYPFWMAAWAVVLAFGLWMAGSWVRYDAPLGRKLFVRGTAVAVVVAAGFWMLPAPPPAMIPFEDYSADRLSELQAEGKPVLVKFTASWCLKCKDVERNVFRQEDIARDLRQRKVAAVKADVSRRGSEADKFLKEEFGGQPPLTAIYPAGGGKPILLRGGFSKDDLRQALDRAGAKGPGG